MQVKQRLENEFFAAITLNKYYHVHLVRLAFAKVTT